MIWALFFCLYIGVSFIVFHVGTFVRKHEFFFGEGVSGWTNHGFYFPGGELGFRMIEFVNISG